jgi:hypothetical protein
MKSKFIAREKELDVLNSALARSSSSFMTIYGRRRIGKTKTVIHFCQHNDLPYLEFTGKYDQNRTQQIQGFVNTLEDAGANVTNPINDWTSAFRLLKQFIDKQVFRKKFVVFIDEMPWLDTNKSGLVGEIADFWNRYADRRDDIILIVCGSAASYMIRKVVNNKGPLHARMTDIIDMSQFNLHDTKAFIHAHGLKHYNHKAIANLYMSIGGVAMYLKLLNSELLPEQAIQSLCFDKNGVLTNEYNTLYKSLFNNAVTHEAIMKTLSSRWEGLTRQQLAQSLKTTHRSISIALEELMASGFISETKRFGNIKQDTLYSATDFFSYFHNRWMSGHKKAVDWVHAVNSNEFATWSGYAFEKLCHLHINQIKSALGINGIVTTSSYWSYRPKTSDEKGAQIDLLIKHKDSRNVELVECKYYDGPFTITKRYKQDLYDKRNVFNAQTNNKYNTRIVIIAPFGVIKNEHFYDVNPFVIKLDCLFAKDK